MRLFSHITRADLVENHAHAVSACIDHPPKNWKWPQGRSRHNNSHVAVNGGTES